MYGSTVYSWVRQKAYLRWALDALGALFPPFAAHCHMYLDDTALWLFCTQMGCGSTE